MSKAKGKRELDIEDPDAIRAVLVEAGADIDGLPAYLAAEGGQELEGICRAADAMGVFGVPTFVVDGEIFWGREHLPEIREQLSEASVQAL